MNRVTLFVDVIVPLSVPKRYTYRVPEALNEEMVTGKRVIVPFGGNKLYTGIIYQLHEKAPLDYEARYVEAVLDDLPVVTEAQLKFWDWISFYYCANPGDVMNAALPSGLKLSSSSHIQLHPDFDAGTIELTEREQVLVDTLHVRITMGMDDVAELLKIKTIQPLLQKLIKKNVLVVYEEVKEKYKPKLQTFLALSDEYADETKLQELLSSLEKKAFRQAEVVMAYLAASRYQSGTGEWIAKADLVRKTDTGAVSSLVKKGVFVAREIEISRLQYEKSTQRIKSLNAEQTQAIALIKEGFTQQQPVLLHGVTGSGKTEVYIHLIEEALKEQKQVLYLVPEIALTTQLIARLRAVFGEAIGVYHSRFSENERVEIWQHLLNADASSTKYQVIVGARSALFLPYTNLQLVIVDEEHDSSFKQHDPAPRYHARDAALYLAAQNKCTILLGSATPSLESFQNALQGKYKLVTLNHQYVQGGGTELEICDLNFYARSNQMHGSLSAPLYNAVQKAITEKKQVILFQNRRGFAPYTECRKCGHVPHCIQCDVSLIYHKQQQKLVCHYCGYTIDPPKVCAACGSNELHYKGLGTEKIEEDIELLFPKARIARMDLDSTRSKFAYKQLIDEFEAGLIDILIGTQMVSKGLDFKNVGVVGVLNADAIINFPDFRSFERAYQLLTQVRGRAGRNNEIGKVLIQTAQPAHKVIELLKKNDYRLFFEETLLERQQFHYPPYTRMIEINVISKDENEVNHLSHALYKLLDAVFKGHVLGPKAPIIARIKNSYYRQLLLKVPKEAGAKAVRQSIYTALDQLQAAHKDWRYRVALDVDPV